ncbi:DNA-binding protein [Frigidibacter sp. MR17.24]|uniref:DNA-binding protein n=1 Tax=Frigidibacter sp. MR17.24 TaxID=3127345 RepID=UPI003012D792
MGRQRHEMTFAPRLLPSPIAAAYLGVSESLLRTLDIPRVTLNSKRLYDRLDLDDFASNLPKEGEAEQRGENTCDAVLRKLTGRS